MRRLLILFSVLFGGCPGVVCGDGVLDSDEACDDGNTANADGCEADCSLPACGNGIVDPGEACFFEPVEVETDIAPTGVVAEDLNGDGTPDLVTANAAGNSLSVLLGDGVGGFVRSPDIELGQITFFAAVGEFDGDGVLDVAASLPNLNEIKVFRGLGDGSFASLVTLPVVDPDSLIVADFNGDQLPDLASTSDTEIVVFRNNGAGGFLAPLFSEAGSRIFELKSGDFNGDELPDLVALTKDNEDTFLVLLGDSAGNFAVQAPETAGDGSVALLAADLSGDSFFDVAIGHLSAGEISVLNGDDVGVFVETQTIGVRSPFALVAGDINGDGALDIAAASGLDQKNVAHLAVSLSNGAGSFALPLLFPAGPADPRGLVLADFNGDGALDAAMTDQGFGRVLVFLSQP
jgi:cysteine-rich repeat protein